MASPSDSGGETGYESNDSNLIFDSVTSEEVAGDRNSSRWMSPPPYSVNFSCLSNMDLPERQPDLQHSPGIHGGLYIDQAPHYLSKLRARIVHRNCHMRLQRISCLIPRILTRLGERKLRIASSLNNIDAVRKLLEIGIDPCAADERKRTALHLAACKGYTDVVRLLLENGASPNQQDVIGNTPLHLAVCTNKIEVVTALLKAGVDVESMDVFGLTAMKLAQSKLRLLQLDKSSSSDHVRNEVNQVIEMIKAYLSRTGLDNEAELLTAFSKQMVISNTKQEVDNNVHDLLSKLSDLNLT